MSEGKSRTAVGSVEDFEENRFVLRRVGPREIGIVRLGDGSWRALRNWCPHKGAPICKGILGGTWPPSAPGELSYDDRAQVLVCPWHGFEYDLVSGREMFGTGQTRLRLYDVTVEDGTVYVKV